ncbi:MAG: LTA synthase family protein [Clostridiales Family XIII bacterium]|jgi:phosphoglycerol transferase MdoB-like AlkP superfamily enzyme|nr:LTA synthase family protein [Clostridiales Family XIII bacterium]
MTPPAALALALNFTIESLGRHSAQLALGFMAAHTAVFMLNAMIIFATLSTAMLFRRRAFVYALCSFAWLSVGIVNGVILGFRMTPFTVTDLSLLEAGLSVIPNYMSSLQIGLSIAAAAAAALGFVAVFVFAPRKKGPLRRLRSAAAVAMVFAALAGALVAGVKTRAVDTFFGNLNYAYRDYGVAYCFLNTWLNTGIRRPAGYSEAAVLGAFGADGPGAMSSGEITVDEGTGREDIDRVLSGAAWSAPRDELPNIVFLQLESFIDPTEIEGLSFSEAPTPYFHYLKDSFSSGYLTVPSIGAGTANTEFEVLSGMSVKFFGPGEYPYKSVLKKESCETMAYSLKGLGYSSHAIHNHRGAFYGRNRVFSNLGFDTFTSLEYMNYVTKTPGNWARDSVLTREIMGAMRSTEGRDFIYAISVQGHGSYPSGPALKDPAIRAYGLLDEGDVNGFEYYLQQINDMDGFLRALTAALESCGEDVALVMYGDHLPAMDLGDGDMRHGSSFETEYVIWSNFGLEKRDRDLAAYQLGAELQSRLGITEGTLMAYHQRRQGEAGYLTGLKMLQYDMLYGDRHVYGGDRPFAPTRLQMGYSPIRIKEILEIGGGYYVSGEGFTPFSKVSIGDSILDTIFLSPSLLKLLEKAEPDDVRDMQVSQVEKDNDILSTTE